MKVFVLGHRGMLGHVLVRYLSEQGMEVITTNERYSGSPEDPLVAAVKNSDADWIINTIGKLNSKTTSSSEMLLVNAQLPVHLKSCLRKNQRMIHASTDGVFSGRTGNYAVDAERDATDIYGFSKILGEVVAGNRVIVVRTSMIGQSESEVTGLMSWFLAQTTVVQGFTNHFWNGITTLEWSKLCREIIVGQDSFPQGILQPTCSNSVSKYELLLLVAETQHSRQIPVTRAEHSSRVDRTLIPTHRRPSIRQQLEELVAWY